MFGLIDVQLEKMEYQMLPYKIFCHCFYFRRVSKSVGSVTSAVGFLVDDNDISKKINCEFILTKSSPAYLLIYNLFEQVNTKTVVLNIYYLDGDYIEKRTKDFGEIFPEFANNPFSLYIFYLEINLRVYLNLLKAVTKAITDNYLSEHCCPRQQFPM